MEKYFLSLGIIGSFLSLIGNVPMVIHLLRAKKSDGQSVYAWFVWLGADTLLLIYASHIQDFVFITLQALCFFFHVLMIYLITKYRKRDKNVATL
jgi:lipid-A-disaccharide synthase-like uncharacterized protein